MTARIGTPHRHRVARSVRFGVLGPLTVTGEHDSFNLGGIKQRTVLAMLIAHAGDSVSIDSIIEAVWRDETPSTARRNTQTYVATLRGQVGDVIQKTSQGWKLVADRGDIDALAFEDRVASASA
jgi:DNA-binding SARP family transcriptional activator